MNERPHLHEPAAALLGGILRDGRQLLRDEIELAKLDLRARAGRLRAAGFDLGVGVALVGLAGLLLATALALGLSTLFGWDAWAGFALVGLVAGAAGAPCLWRGRRRARGASPVPGEAVASVRETGRWLRSKVG